jgi:hypothetical protein
MEAAVERAAHAIECILEKGIDVAMGQSIEQAGFAEGNKGR